jgi:gluconolactonase
MNRCLIAFLMLGGVSLVSVSAQSNVASVHRIDAALDRLIAPGTAVEKLAGGFQRVEGPVWIRRDGYLLFSDLNSIRKWTTDGNVSVFRERTFAGPAPDGVRVGTNGLALDPQGRLVSVEHGNRRVSRIEQSGSITVLADRYEGKRLNSPNDLAIRRNGDIYFTDPPYFPRQASAGAHKEFQQELTFSGVYRVTSAGALELLIKDLPSPNGLAFSPDERKLYVANSRPEKRWMVYDVDAGGTLTNGKVFLDVSKEPGEDVPDGLKVDAAGNLYATGPGGIMVISPQGTHLGTIRIPEIAANCAWGDADGKTLYITARTGLYRIRLNATGMRP